MGNMVINILISSWCGHWAAVYDCNGRLFERQLSRNCDRSSSGRAVKFSNNWSHKLHCCGARLTQHVHSLCVQAQKIQNVLVCLNFFLPPPPILSPAVSFLPHWGFSMWLSFKTFQSKMSLRELFVQPCSPLDWLCDEQVAHTVWLDQESSRHWNVKASVWIPPPPNSPKLCSL